MIFPDPRNLDPSDSQGLVAHGGDLTLPFLLEAYARGIFPWPQGPMDQFPLLWFSPDPRGILDFAQLHLAKSFLKWKKSCELSVTCNARFTEVIRRCRLKERKGQSGTWILPEMETAYAELFLQGKALSVEVWKKDLLVAGIYGVLSEKYFSAESMFTDVPNASKLAFVELVEELRRRGFAWMDLQMVTSVSKAFGAKLIPRSEFLDRIIAGRPGRNILRKFTL